MLAIAKSIINNAKSEEESIQEISAELNKNNNNNSNKASSDIINNKLKIPEFYKDPVPLVQVAVEAVKPKLVKFLLRRRPKLPDDLLLLLCSHANLSNEEDVCTILTDLVISGAEFSKDVDFLYLFPASSGLLHLCKELLISVPKDQQHLSRALCVAARNNFVGICRELLDAGADVNLGWCDEEDGDGDDDAKYHDDSSPLAIACASGSIQVVELLLSRGASLYEETPWINEQIGDVKDGTSEEKLSSPIIVYAASSGSIEIMKLILDAAAKIENFFKFSPQHVCAALHECIVFKHYLCFDLLLRRQGNPHNGVDEILATACWLGEHGFPFIQILLDWIMLEIVYVEESYVKWLVEKNAIQTFGYLLLMDHGTVAVMCRASKEYLQLLIDKCAVSETMKRLLKERMNHQDEDGLYLSSSSSLSSSSVRKIKEEVKNEDDDDATTTINTTMKVEKETGSRRKRNTADTCSVVDEQKKPKNSAAARKTKKK